MALDDWKKKGMVEPFPSNNWVCACNPLFVEKKNVKIRTCIDYRPINQAMEDYAWPLPRLQDIRHWVQGYTWFSCLDLRDAFFNLSFPQRSDQPPHFGPTAVFFSSAGCRLG